MSRVSPPGATHGPLLSLASDSAATVLRKKDAEGRASPDGAGSATPGAHANPMAVRVRSWRWTGDKGQTVPVHEPRWSASASDDAMQF